MKRREKKKSLRSFVLKENERKKDKIEEEKAKEENLRKAKEENERKEFEAREKIKQESEPERQSKVVELKSNSNPRELIVRVLVFNPSPIPSMNTQFSNGVLPSLNSCHFFIKSFVLFPFQTFCSTSHSLISYFSISCAKTHFDSKILLKNHLSQSVRHSFCEVGLIQPFSIFKSPFSHIAQSILLHGHYDFNAIFLWLLHICFWS